MALFYNIDYIRLYNIVNKKIQNFCVNDIIALEIIALRDIYYRIMEFLQLIQIEKMNKQFFMTI